MEMLCRAVSTQLTEGRDIVDTTEEEGVVDVHTGDQSMRERLAMEMADRRVSSQLRGRRRDLLDEGSLYVAIETGRRVSLMLKVASMMHLMMVKVMELIPPQKRGLHVVGEEAVLTEVVDEGTVTDEVVTGSVLIVMRERKAVNLCLPTPMKMTELHAKDGVATGHEVDIEEAEAEGDVAADQLTRKVVNQLPVKRKLIRHQIPPLTNHQPFLETFLFVSHV